VLFLTLDWLNILEKAVFHLESIIVIASGYASLKKQQHLRKNFLLKTGFFHI